MKKAEIRQAEEFLDLLEQAHSEIRKSLDKKDVSTALTLLEDCQDGAISLGNLIEATEGEGFVTVPLLEEYCELVYQLHESLAGEESVETGKVYKLLRNRVIRIRNSVRNDIKVRKEVVFLPYKASMWDSLESVWRAADEDPDCDAYVIPIPYYDKNPDGSFREMHYEGNLYPKDVPVTWYKDYDFAENRPDMIFIHNPYDECNYVTSVDPDFYSGKLKEYTDKLVYIPYFILAEPDLQNDSLENMAHFCTVPGVINANQVIVQSEDMRKAYIRILTKAYGENTRAIWAKKILGIGSPKVDKVLNTKKEDLEIPAEWLKVIQKPDGSWKRIILYNTSVNALLKHDEKMLVKMQDVFRVFKENQDEVTLLWRPHPLIEATIESMRPQLWMEYRKLQEQYRTEGWGIYDDSADVDRAIVVSDAYYGDPSSVVQLYEKLEKPIMYQSVEVKKLENEKIKIVPYLMGVHEDDIYMIDGTHDALYKLNDEMDKCEFVSCLEGDGKSYPYFAMTCIGDEFFLTPDSGLYCAIYNIVTKQAFYLSLEEFCVDSNNIKRASFYHTVVWGDGVFLIGFWNSSIIYIDYLKKKIEQIYEGRHDEDRSIAMPFLIGDYGKYGQNLYIPVFNSDSIIVLNIEQQTCSLLKIDMGLSISTACVYGESLYVFGTNGRDLCEISIAGGEKTVYKLNLPEGFYQDCGQIKYPFVFVGTFYYEGCIWLIPVSNTNMILKMNVKTKSISCVVGFSKHYIISYTIWKDELWLYTLSGLLRINMKTAEWKEQEIYLEQKDYMAYRLSQRDSICSNEELDIDLQIFCQKSQRREKNHEKEQKNIHGNIGNKWVLW